MYELNWFGKLEAIENTYKPTNKKLIEDKESSKNWDDTENLYIEGDNLDVLKLLQKDYFGKIKMIYIDPPYNTGKDFVYKDNFRDNIANYKEITNQSTKANPETNGRYHTDWLNMMYPRLKLARNLLSDDGAIFISISNEEYANLKKVCDEIFGENNYIETFIWTKTSTPPSLSTKSRKTVEYIICYEKFKNNNKYKGELLENGDVPLINGSNKDTILTFPPKSIKFKISDGFYKNGKYDKVDLLNDINIKNKVNQNEVILKGKFKWTQETLENEISNGTYFLIKSEKFSIRFQRILNEEMYKTPTNFISYKNMHIELNSNENIGTNEAANKELTYLGMKNTFDYAKPTSLIKYITNFIVDKDDLVLDFFSGSSTTAHAIMELNAEDNGNRKFIMVQLPETTDEKSEAYKAGYSNICGIGKERIRRAGEKIVSESGKTDLDIGFKVFKLEEENSMKSLFNNNSEIDITIDWIIKPKEAISKFKIDGELYYLAKENDKYIIYSNNSKKKEKSKVYVLASIFYVEGDVDYLQLEKEYVDKLVEFNQGWYHSDYVTCRILDEVYKNINK